MNDDHEMLDVINVYSYPYYGNFDHSRLLGLPAELLADIVDMLADDKEALKNLRLTHSCIGPMIEKILFKKIRLVAGCENSMDQLIQLKQNPRFLGTLASTLIIPLECLNDEQIEQRAGGCHKCSNISKEDIYCHDRKPVWESWQNALSEYVAESAIDEVKLVLNKHSKRNTYKDRLLFNKFYEIIWPVFPTQNVKTLHIAESISEKNEQDSFCAWLDLCDAGKLDVPSSEKLDTFMLSFHDNEDLLNREDSAKIITKFFENNLNIQYFSASNLEGLHLVSAPCNLTNLVLNDSSILFTDLCYALHMSPKLKVIQMDRLVISDVLEDEELDIDEEEPYERCCELFDSGTRTLWHLWRTVQELEDLTDFVVSIDDIYMPCYNELDPNDLKELLTEDVVTLREIVLQIGEKKHKLTNASTPYKETVSNKDMEGSLRKIMPNFIHGTWHTATMVDFPRLGKLHADE